ncbi:DUF5641 domain-containing protein [Trichonephila clavipes]|nr:DUF5641 domain-containing protein [Trichonephila clavipes]
MQNGDDICNKSKILNLSPFLDDKGIIQVGGRLKHSRLPYSSNHPILLPAKRNSKFSYEELLTLITQIEAILNSRPLTPLSSDVDDLEVLTPAHFLIGRPITAIVEPSLLQCESNRLNVWQRITKSVQTIWKRNITPLEDRYVALKAKKNRNFTPDQIAANLVIATSTHVSARPISRRLKEVGLCTRKNLFVPSHLNHAIIDRDYAVGPWDLIMNLLVREIKTFGDRWFRVIFADESRFSVTSDSGRQILWKEHGIRYVQKFVCERDRYVPGVMAWKASCTMAKHCFTSLSEEALHRNSIAEIFF